MHPILLLILLILSPFIIGFIWGIIRFIFDLPSVDMIVYSISRSIENFIESLVEAIITVVEISVLIAGLIIVLYLLSIPIRAETNPNEDSSGANVGKQKSRDIKQKSGKTNVVHSGDTSGKKDVQTNTDGEEFDEYGQIKET